MLFDHLTAGITVMISTVICPIVFNISIANFILFLTIKGGLLFYWQEMIIVL